MKKTNQETATECWGGASTPDWIACLALACDTRQGGQSAVGRLLDVSGALINQVLHKKYTASYQSIEIKVRGVLMAQTVSCPGLLMEIPINECASYQKQEHSTANPTRARLYRACRSGCPHSQIGTRAGGEKA